MIVHVCNHSSEAGSFQPACENKGRIVLHPDGVGDLSADDLALANRGIAVLLFLVGNRIRLLFESHDSICG